MSARRTSPAPTMRGPVGGAALLVLAALASAPPGVPFASAPAEAARRGPLQIAGTWDATWQNSSGASRRGLIVVEQNGASLSARVESHGNVTAAGSISGADFTLRGRRLGVPFTISGRVGGRRMRGTLTSLLVERHFSATRRRGR